MELQIIQSKIYEIRGMRVMLDYDLAEMYQVETKNLKRSVRRNIERFPEDFMFELTKEEYDFLRCNFGTLENSGRGQIYEIPALCIHRTWYSPTFERTQQSFSYSGQYLYYPGFCCFAPVCTGICRT